MRILLSFVAVWLALLGASATELNLGAMVQPVPLDSKFAISNYYVWCGSCVKGDDGRYHLFYSRWPTNNPNKFAPGWAIVSEVAYAIGDSPRGPFTHVNVALPKRGTNAATGQKFWDADMTHNPYCIRKDGKWYLYYLGNYGDGTYNNHLNHDRIGLAVADNPAGPWTRFDQAIVDVSTNAADFDSLRLANPAVTIRPDGKILMIYKAVTAATGNAVRFGACIADSPTNTYVKQASVAGQIFKAAGGDWMVAEDPFIWFSPNYDNLYYAVARDVVGTFTGVAGGIALFKSQDGLNWTNAANPAVLGAAFKWANGSNSLSKIERPWVLLENNEPKVLFGGTDGYDPGGRISYNVQIPLTPVAVSRPPIVVLPLGDSITLGASVPSWIPGGYRAPLLTLLTNAGYQIQFVGSDTNNPTSALTAAGNGSHEGHGSYTTSNLLANLDAVAAGPSANNGGFWLTGISGVRAPVYPDVILLMAGVNDLGVNQLSATQGLAGLDALINKLAVLRPAANIIVSTLTPYTGAVYPNREAHQQEFNAVLPALVAAHQAAGQRVTLCDVRTRVNLTNAAALLCSDGVHPNQAGYNEIALAWFDAITKLPASTPPVVAWNSPSANALGSMPLGNGDITLNAWCETNGDLLFYIGKSDSWEDNSRLAKLGKVRVKLSPPLLPAGATFNQTLNPLRGEMTVTVTPTNSGATSLKVWVDANNPVVHIQINAPSNITATASFELWRTNSTVLSSIEASDINYDTSQPNNMHAPTVVEPDTVLGGNTDGVGWFHRNNKSLGPNETMSFQDLLGAPSFVDPILGRTFGCLLRGPSFVRANDQTIVSSNATSHRFDIYALTKFPATSNEWLTAIHTAVTNTEATPFANRYDAHVAWWSEFWDRSYIEITARTNAADPAAATDVATAYALQRFVTACAGRGNYPIKFNGSSFAMPWSGKPGDADYRRWGGGYWWQNTRLPYAGLCTSGDYDMMPSLFRMYLDDVLSIARYRAGYYFTDPRFDDSSFMSEVTYPWGAVFSTTYGWTTPAASRSPDDGKLQTGQYHKREWVGGLELSFMLLDYYDHTGDTNYLTQKILPATLPLVRWFDRYYTNIVGGKLVMNPSQALETWWTCTNAMPEVAGLQAVVARLLALPTDLVAATDRDFLTSLQAKIPALPTRVVGSTTMLAPAQSYSSKNNSELPEQYAVYPFRLCSFEKTNAAWGVAAYDAASSSDKGANGWRQDDIFLAYLGLADRAKTNVVSRARNKDASCRFPGFFGPNFDWTPDQCHGGVLMKAVQAMLLQTEGDKIFLLPAWPKDWDVKLKLHAPKQTTVEGVVSNGVLVSYTVTPPSRYNDVQVSANFIQPFAGTPVSGYQLAWSDEFSDATLDTNKWNYRTDSKLWSAQLPANVTISNGILNLNLKKQTVGSYSYTGAGVISKPAFKYGYYETRMRTPPGRGWHTSFWMQKHDGSGGTGTSVATNEFDCIENDSINSRQYGVNIHKWNPSPHVTYGGKTITLPTNAPSLTADFHVYGCEYTPATVKYFLDGALVQTVDATQFPQGDVNIWLTSIAANFAGTTNVDDSQLPNVAQYDYARFFTADTNAAPGVSVNILSPGVGGTTLRGTNVTLRALAVVTMDDLAPVILWSKLSGPGFVAFGNATNADTTATFSAPGIYTLQCAASVNSNSASARVSVNVLAAGASGTNAPVQLRQGVNGYSHLATFIRQDTPTWNSGARDQILVGKFNNGGFRMLFSYDLSALPTNVLVTGAQLDLVTHNSQAGAGALGAVELHPLLSTPVEGTGDGSNATNGVGTGATWASRTGGTNVTHVWTNAGGDFATNVLATAPGFSGTTMSLPISFAMSPALGTDAQLAKSAGQPWNFIAYSPATEAGANGIFARICSDDHATLTNRPLLTLSFEGNFAPVVATGIAPAATTGVSVPLNGSASNATATVWSQLSGPGIATFGNESQPATIVSFDAAGNYLLRLTASNAFAQVTSDLLVVVTNLPTLDGIIISNRLVRFRVNGQTGANYTVQASTNLVAWTNLFTTNPLVLPFLWQDIFATNFPRRFYRVLLSQ